MDPRKCPAHNFWMRKGQCEICLLEREKRQKQYEQAGGSNKQPINIGTTDVLNQGNKIDR